MNDSNTPDYSGVYNNPQPEMPDAYDPEVIYADLIKKGKKEAIALMVLLGISFVSSLGSITGIAELIGAAIPLVLCVFILKRKNWARIALGVIYAIATAFQLAVFVGATVKSISGSPESAAMFIFFALFSIAIPLAVTFILLFSKRVKAYCGKFPKQ